MLILKALNIGVYAYNVHRVRSIKIARPSSVGSTYVGMSIEIDSWKELADVSSGPLLRTLRIDGYFPSTTTDLFTDMSNWLINNDETEFFAGSLLDFPEEGPSLDTAKIIKWSEIKSERLKEINSPLVTPYGTLDATAEERANITDAVLLAQTLASLNQTVAINWTMSDNSVVVLDAAKMTTVGLLLGSKVQTAHAKARILRSAIDSAINITELSEVSWSGYALRGGSSNQENTSEVIDA